MTSDNTSSQSDASSKFFHQGKGDSNLSKNRLVWEARSKDDIEGRKLIEQDNQYFIHQSLSTPCLAEAKKVEGVWVEDTVGRRFMDFHDNNVHHIGYANLKLAQAIKDQINLLPITARRFTDAPAVKLAKKIFELAPGDNSKVLFATGGSDAINMVLKLARPRQDGTKRFPFGIAFIGLVLAVWQLVVNRYSETIWVQCYPVVNTSPHSHAIGAPMVMTTTTARLI